MLGRYIWGRYEKKNHDIHRWLNKLQSPGSQTPYTITHHQCSPSAEIFLSWLFLSCVIGVGSTWITPILLNACREGMVTLQLSYHMGQQVESYIYMKDTIYTSRMSIPHLQCFSVSCIKLMPSIYISFVIQFITSGVEKRGERQPYDNDISDNRIILLSYGV